MCTDCPRVMTDGSTESVHDGAFSFSGMTFTISRHITVSPLLLVAVRTYTVVPCGRTIRELFKATESPGGARTALTAFVVVQLRRTSPPGTTVCLLAVSVHGGRTCGGGSSIRTVARQSSVRPALSVTVRVNVVLRTISRTVREPLRPGAPTPWSMRAKRAPFEVHDSCVEPPRRIWVGLASSVQRRSRGGWSRSVTVSRHCTVSPVLLVAVSV